MPSDGVRSADALPPEILVRYLEGISLGSSAT